MQIYIHIIDTHKLVEHYQYQYNVPIYQVMKSYLQYNLIQSYIITSTKSFDQVPGYWREITPSYSY